MKKPRPIRLITILILLIPVAAFSQGWENVGGGLNGDVNALCVFDGDLYAAGEFTSPAHIARWNGTQWEDLNSQLNGSVTCMCDYNGKLYISGEFTSVTGLSSLYVARFDGQIWEAIDFGLDLPMRDMAVFRNELYFAGDFHIAGGLPVTGIARYDGINIKTAGDVLFFGPVYSLHVYDNSRLWAAGDFNQVNEATALRMASWDGTSWSVADGGSYGPVYAMASWYGGDLYFGGVFNAIFGTSANNVGGLSAATESWYALENGVTFNGAPASVIIEDMLMYEGNLHIGGYFNNAGSYETVNFAIWDGLGWVNTASNLDNSVKTLVAYNGEIYAGGSFTTPVNRVGRWNGPTSVGEAIEGPGRAVAYPNPASGRVTITFDREPGGDHMVEVYSIAGKKMLMAAFNPGIDISLDVSHLDQGTYFFQVSGADGSEARGRFLIMR